MTEKTNSWQQNTGFKPHSQTDWRNSVDKLLAGADFNNALVSHTLDNIEIQPLYQQQANAPFLGRGEAAWSIQQSYDQGQNKEANRQILADLTGGITCLELKLATTVDESTTKQSGLYCFSTDDLEQLLAGVHAEMIQLSLTPGSENRLTGALLLAYYHRQKIAPESVHCALNIDPLNTQAKTGQCAQSTLQALQHYASYCAQQFPNATSVCVDSSVYHNAGCTEAQEIAYTLSTTVDYLRALQSLDADTAFKQLCYRIALDSDFFLNVAKLRATRELLRQVQQNCGVTQPATTLIDAVSGSRTMTTLDSSINILRTSAQTAAAMTGGANGFNCTAYDQLTNNSDKARRLARNTHHVLIEESGLLDVDDPTRGSGYIEALTKALCNSAWTLFQHIESEGGMQQVLTSGLIAEQIKQSCQKRSEAMNKGESMMIGVTGFPNQQETPVKSNASTSTFKISSSEDKNTPDSPVSVSDLIHALSEGGSTLDNYHHNAARVSEPLLSFRDAERFETLRLRSNAHKNISGSAPKVILLTVGNRKDYAARADFCKNFFAVAGITTTIVEITDADIQKLCTDNKQLTVLCSSDKRYLDIASALPSLDNIKNLWIAGNNPKVLAALKDNITESIHLRCDKLASLEKALTVIGVSA